MSNHFRSLLKPRPILIGLSLFSLMWMVVQEVNFRYAYYHDPGYFGSHVSPPLYYEEIFLSALLVTASVALLAKRMWGSLAAMFVSGTVMFECLFRDFWLLARRAEVPRYSYQHFSLWWPNLGEGQLLQIILSGLILSCSVVSLIRGARSRGNRTMPNNGMHPTPRHELSHDS
jgi:hypothetical protein